ncbi:MAG: DUF6273 domain-containing protein [Eubacteriales bacterium]
MSNILNLISEETFSDKMDTQNALLAAIASGNGGIGVTSFKDLQTLTRLGLASKVLSIGDQIVCGKVSATVATVGNSAGNVGITAAAVDRDTFVHAIGTSYNGDYEFYWDGAAWHYGGDRGEAVELSAYGITVTGTPAIGDEIVVHETATYFVYDVIGIDHDIPSDKNLKHSITLQLHDCMESMPFDAKEAFYYAEEGLAAGTYLFAVGQHAWVASEVGKIYQFTLTKPVPAGGQLVLSASYNATIEGTTVSTYASSTATTAIETVVITSGTTGMSLGTISNTVGGNLNSMLYALVGNNNYAQSAIRQYLNSNGAAGSVWTPQNKFDRPPTWVAGTSGFLNGMDEDFLAVIGEVDKITDTTSDGSETTAERFFMLSRSEVYGGKENGVGEEAYPYYSENSELSAAGTGADTNRSKYRNGVAVYWWLRSPSTGYSSTDDSRYVHCVDSAGAVNAYGCAYVGYGIAPACCIV